MLNLLSEIQRRMNYLDRTLPKPKVLPVRTNEQRADRILELQKRADFDPNARVKLNRVMELMSKATRWRDGSNNRG